jgi:LysR family transcriptional regulator, hydrogen peroxide-inducible genes activator
MFGHPAPGGARDASLRSCRRRHRAILGALWFNPLGASAMEFHEIRYFLAVSEHLNFTRAAEHCNVSQPALTRAIKKLEDELGGGQLVHRERGNTHLTELGRMMKPYFEQVMGQMLEARRRAQDFAHLTESRLSVGLMCTVGPLRLVGLFDEFNSRFPGIELYLRDARAQVLEDQLMEGGLDLAIYAMPVERDDHFHRLPLYSERFMIAVAPRHPLARLNAIALRDLDRQRYLSRANCEYAEAISAIAEEQGVHVAVPYVSERDDWIQAMVLAGLGCTTIPEFAATLPGLCVRPLVEPEVWRVVKLVTVRGRPHSPAVGAFVHVARQHRWEGAPRESVAPAVAVPA